MLTLRLTALTYSVQSPPPAGNASVASVSTDVIPAGYTAIYTAEDLNNVRNNLSGKYILMNDIDLSSVANWEPIGEYTSASDFSLAFQGDFDGNGHIIKNLTINKESDLIGLFGATASGSIIKNLGMENVNITGNDNVGGLVGYSYGTITNCYVTGNVSGNTIVGGLIGNSYGTITNCYSTGNVSGKQSIGGLAGYIDGITSNCYSTGNVSGTEAIGGIAGCSSASTISNCYTSGIVTGKETIGGIIGGAYNDSELSNCYSAKIVTGTHDTGDIAGKTSHMSTGIAIISNCKAIEQSEFKSHEFWDSQNLDSDVWEMSYAIPPILKGVGGNQGNWYFKRGSNETRLQVGEGSEESANALFVNSGLDLAGMNIDLSTVDGCLDAIDCVKAALDAVAQRTADIGVSQSRLETISNVNTTKIENLTAAYATVTEADVAEETMNFTKSQILASTAASLITQTQAFQANLLLRMINSLG